MILSSASPQESIDKALKQLGTDYIDLYLIHQPFSLRKTHMAIL